MLTQKSNSAASSNRRYGSGTSEANDSASGRQARQGIRWSFKTLNSISQEQRDPSETIYPYHVELNQFSEDKGVRVKPTKYGLFELRQRRCSHALQAGQEVGWLRTAPR